MLSLVNPWTEKNGAATVTRGLLKLLALPPLRARCDCEPVRPAPPRFRRLAQARSVFQSFVTGVPAKAAFLRTREFRERAAARLGSRRYDAIVLNGSDLLWILPELPPAVPKIVVVHNLEHVLYGAQIERPGAAYGPLRVLLRRDCERLRAFEREGLRKAGSLVFLSLEEEAAAREFCPDARRVTIPPVFDSEPCRGARGEPGAVREIGYLGNFGWWPNQQGLRWFTDKVLPGVSAPVRLSLFGPGSDKAAGKDGRIVGRGEMEGLEEVWTGCDFLICPAAGTGGVCVKLAEAVYHGVPVLATTAAARGLPLGPERAVVLLDEPKEWAEFLNSPRAAELAASRVPERTRIRFAVASHVDRFQGFISGALAAPACAKV